MMICLLDQGLSFSVIALLGLLYACLAVLGYRRKHATACRQRRLSEESAKRPTLGKNGESNLLREKERPTACKGSMEQSQTDYVAVFAAVIDPGVSLKQRQQIQSDKVLYHELQNIEDHPGSLERARARLLQLMDETMQAALQSPSGSILSIPSYSPGALRDHFERAHSENVHKYEAYLARRKRGGPRELFPTREHAVRWLELAAVVKYVDGGWVANVLGIDTASTGEQVVGLDDYDGGLERRAGKLAWQVMSEEFGDGDLAKNHVFVYNELLNRLRRSNSGAPPGDKLAFDGLSDDGGSPRCWTAAIAQLCIGLLASTGDFFPEAIGFNMAYETLPYHLLVTSRELREMKIDDYYFALHITIDNPDSGHAAIARAAVDRFLEAVKQRDGQEALAKMWRRVQAGVVLADGLPTTPWAPITFTLDTTLHRWVPLRPHSSLLAMATETESRLVHLLARKALAAQKMHCPSRLSIGGNTIEHWLEPSSFTFDKGLAFVRALSGKTPWVAHGNAEHSRLVREMEWGGRMFGAFSQDEVRIVRTWIDSLGDDPVCCRGAYHQFVGEVVHGASQCSLFATTAPNVMARFPRVSDVPLSSSTLLDSLSQPPAECAELATSDIMPIWFTTTALLEAFPLSPTRFASPLGMTVLRILRAQLGFPALHGAQDICAGMDEVFAHTDPRRNTALGVQEIGHALCRRLELRPVSTYSELVKWLKTTNSPAASLCRDLLALRTRPYANQALLLGATWGSAKALYRSPKILAHLLSEERCVLERISSDIHSALHDLLRADATEKRAQEWKMDFTRGFSRITALIEDKEIRRFQEM